MIYQINPKHGYHIAYDQHEAIRNEKNGWKTVTKEEFYADEAKGTTGEVERIVEVIEEKAEEELTKQYEAKFGKKPHHRLKRESIEKALKDANSQ